MWLLSLLLKLNWIVQRAPHPHLWLQTLHVVIIMITIDYELLHRKLHARLELCAHRAQVYTLLSNTQQTTCVGLSACLYLHSGANDIA